MDSAELRHYTNHLIIIIFIVIIFIQGNNTDPSGY